MDATSAALQHHAVQIGRVGERFETARSALDVAGPPFWVGDARWAFDSSMHSLAQSADAVAVALANARQYTENALAEALADAAAEVSAGG